jgi:DNA-binding MarR family transcriptional regulator
LKTSLSQLEETLIPWLGRVRKGYVYLVLNEFKEHNLGVSRDQFIVLKTLAENDGQMQNNLAQATERDKTSLARLLNTMERKMLVKRISCPEDGRVNKVFITPKGQQIFDKAIPLIKKVAENSQRNISKEEISNAIQTLKKVHQNLNQYDEIK